MTNDGLPSDAARARADTDAAGTGAAPDDSDPVLVARLRSEIERDGPITFARFMEVALYEPGHGYYATGVARASRGGDFLSAPELHPVFGRLVGRQLAECWERLGRPRPFVVREHGAGSGALAAGIVAGLAADAPRLLEALAYEPVEVDPTATAAIADRLAAAGWPGIVRAPSVDPIVGVVLANELLDALPVHRLERRAGALLELRVDWREGRFVDVVGPAARPELVARLRDEAVDLPDGATVEICLALDGWVDRVAGELTRGFLLVLDYGHPAAELYSPRRARGTVLAYRGHRAHEDLLRDVGRQDLTAHIDLTALDRAAARNGLAKLGRTSQAEFMAALGLGDLLADAAAATVATMAAYLELRAAAVRLLDPRALGGFQVVAFGRQVAPTPPLVGFGFRRPDAPAGSSAGAPAGPAAPHG